MDTPLPYLRKLAAFAAVLVALFAAGLGAGSLLAPAAPGGGDADAHPEAAEAGMTEHGMEEGAHGDHSAAAVRGLAVAENGLRIVLVDRELPAGKRTPLHFRVLRDDGTAVRRFDVTHTKRMHLIVVRRDLAGFRHLHPEMSPDGTWSTSVRLGAPGSYRLIADFSHDGTATTLAADLGVDGDAELRELPAPDPVARTATGYEVRLRPGTIRPGAESELAFTVSRNGRPVATEPYLGAAGHLVSLREGDLAFLHVHPRQGLRFEARFPTAGRYRLFLQFAVGGRVETAAFTEVVG